MKLSIIIPVYNEEKTIMKILQRVKNVKLNLKIEKENSKIKKENIKIEKEIIIIDDCSKDNTRKKLNTIKKSPKIKIIFHEKNQGKGAAIRTGLKHATGDVIIIQDADLEYSPEDYPKLLEPILLNKFKVVYGSRFLNTSFFSKKHFAIPSHYFGNKLLSFITKILFFNKITDMETCYKVFKKEVISKIKLNSSRFEFEPEITAKILKKGYKIKEVPISFNPRSFEEGKKISWKDGLKALYYLLKYRFLD